MCYPIFNNDFLFSNSEMIRYIRAFENSVVIHHPLFLQSEKLFLTDHFFEENLVIRLIWKDNSGNARRIEGDIEAILQAHSNGDINLSGYLFVSYTSQTADIVSQDDTEKFVNYVLKGRKIPMYDKQKYNLIEHNDSILFEKEIDVEFEVFRKRVENLYKFQMYVKNRKRNM